MSMNNKQRWMGGVVLLGGGVLLAALLLKGKEEIHQKQVQTPPAGQLQSNSTGEVVQLQPLTVDVETEKRLLEEQRRARERAVAEQESKTAEFLRMQQEAEAAAARKAAEEYAAINAKRNGTQTTDIPPEIIEDEQAKAKRLAEEKKKVEAEKALAQQKAVEAQKARTEQIMAEQKQKLEAQQKVEAQKKAEAEKQAAKLAAEKKAAEKKAAEAKADAAKKAELAKKEADEKKREAEDAKKKAEAEKARALLEGDNNSEKQWMVQVALAANEANADAVAAKLRAKGYKVTKSPTSKGIRIMVGPAKDREAADATRKKINGDASLNMKSAWVIDWVPLDKRQ